MWRAARSWAGARCWPTRWYDPHRHRADFVILAPGGLSEEPVLATFGPPRRVYHDGVYTVLVWNKNLLTDLNH